MSTESRVQDLELAVRSLSRVVDNLVAQVAELEKHLDFFPGYWALTAEERPFGIPTGIASSRFLTVEWGPPEIPESVLDFGSQLWEGPGPRDRCLRAWNAGFWARASLSCFVRYTPVAEIGLWNTIWVVLRARGISRPVIVFSWVEVNRLIELPGSTVDPIVQGFPTPTEAYIFCAGGGLDIPGHFKWTSNH